ncbi:hypothetical protein PVAND_015911 [Polypedilum vanderplanki]|uniref:C3H1-type domain-containing protein n=1 Tax=Polypedilum vanderplanki TaxID=319348 RepID=A0A9J6BEA7_POLVA|nr:hypothetical protein PVAND_015911 [Polypedilum vanderplanki]
MSQSQKDSQWLQLDVCREHQNGKCLISSDECPQAHPLPHVDVTADGKVMACYDSFKGRCRRISPPCKFYHPTPPLMEVLLARGRNHLAMKTQMQLLQMSEAQQQQIDVLPSTSKTAKIEIGMKRSAEMSPEIPFEMMYFKRPTLQPTALTTLPVIPAPAAAFIPQPIYQPPITIVPTDPNAVIPLNAPFVTYTDSNGQILDNLPVCQDFNRNMCSRINCKFVHLMNPKKLEIHEQRVAVCRDHANGICRRQQCKYYHIPIQLPSASEMALINHFGSQLN